MASNDELSDIYLDENGMVPAVNSVITNEPMARALELVRDQGPDGFYTGQIAEAMVQAVQDAGGVLTLEDLATRGWGLPLHVAAFEVDDVIGSSRTQANWGGREWRMYHVPGHSQDSLVYELPDAGVLLTGDVLFAGAIGRTDFPGGSFSALVEGIRLKLTPLDPHLRVLSGHGPASTLQEELLNNPYLT